MRGRKPTPTPLKLVTGNRGRRPLNGREPQPARKRPRAPAHLSERARKAWRHVVNLLDRMGVLTEADAVAVEMMVEAYAEVVAARTELKTFGSLYYETTNQRGGVMRRAHPAVAVLQDADRRVRSWLAEFGMTASARTRVHVRFAARDIDEYLDEPASKYLDRGFRR